MTQAGLLDRRAKGSFLTSSRVMGCRTFGKLHSCSWALDELCTAELKAVVVSKTWSGGIWVAEQSQIQMFVQSLEPRERALSRCVNKRGWPA